MFCKGRVNKIWKEKGATLLEVVMAVVIAGFGVSAVLGLFVMNLRTSESNREYAACVLLVTDVMERLRAIPCDPRLGNKNVPGLLSALAVNSKALSSFYEYLDVAPPASVLQVIPEALWHSTLNLVPESSEIYVVELKVAWRKNMNPVRFGTLVVKGGINDLLQAD
ncbi:type IV pilus modification PilV family protein [Candidatus Caldatribacterium sp. SIUC1]|uniref:type IV pilus modification PilV family protein n=1 Tax=Candidatus Caldatribacterium sp. SIUC1 TaxID=3418365 RepID=UPI003F68CB61